jgi:hypothetical protein
VDRGLLDEYQLLLHSVILGGGKALFGDVARRHWLRLLRTRTFDRGRCCSGTGTPEARASGPNRELGVISTPSLSTGGSITEEVS